MKKFSKIISFVLFAGMTTSSMQIVGMERLKRGWQSLTEKLSPSQKLRRFKNALSCVWTNNCSPQDMQNIKWGLAAITALIVGGGLVSRVLPSGEVTVDQLMDKYSFYPNSQQVTFLTTLAAYVQEGGGEVEKFASLSDTIKMATKDDFAMLRAAQELLSGMAVSSDKQPGKQVFLDKIKNQLLKF